MPHRSSAILLVAGLQLSEQCLDLIDLIEWDVADQFVISNGLVIAAEGFQRMLLDVLRAFVRSPLVQVVGSAVEELTYLLDVLSLSAVDRIIEQIPRRWPRNAELYKLLIRVGDPAKSKNSL